MQSAVCNRCPLWARCCLTYGGKACHNAAKDAGFEVKPTLFEQIKDMDIEEMAEWLYANCEWVSAEYGACSGANDHKRILEYLESDGEI